MIQLSDEGAWYLAQVKPNGDRLAERNLRQQGFGVFAPKTVRTRRYRDRFREDRRALFPGYLFVSVCSRAAGWRAINSTIGIQKLVSLGDNGPSRVSSELIALIKQRCDNDDTLRPDSIQRGDSVRIVSGPFADFVATIADIPSEHRIWVLLDIMGKGRRILLGAQDVELHPAIGCP